MTHTHSDAHPHDHTQDDEHLPTHASYRITEEVRHALFHALPHLAHASVLITPCGHSGKPVQLSVHHEHPAPA
jgi:hypothetical protein